MYYTAMWPPMLIILYATVIIFFTKTLIQQWYDVKTEATILILVLKAKVGDGKDDVITGGHGFGERNGSGEKLFERVKAAYMIVNV